MRGNAQNVPERSPFRHMCLRDNLTDHAHCGGLVMIEEEEDEPEEEPLGIHATKKTAASLEEGTYT